MQTTEDNLVISKTQELCQTILDQAEFETIRQQIAAFMANEEAKGQYQSLSEKGEYLQHKQTQGVHLTDTEINEFERQREQFFNNPVARGFLDAQEEMHHMQETVQRYVVKTLELGRLPTDEEMNGGSCGHGCGCSH